MNVFLTGGTGYIGSALLRRLVEAGHSVTALVRTDDKARQVRAAGAEPLLGELADTALLGKAAGDADAVVHLASPGDATSPEIDAGVVEAFGDALRGTGKKWLHTSGIWVHGDGADLTEDSPFAPPALTAWRLPLDAKVRAAADEDVHSVVIAPGIVYGHGGGLPNLVIDAPRDADGTLLFPGSGDQHWTTIHVDDAAALYLAALEHAPAGSYYFAASGDNPTVREIAVAASEQLGLGGTVAPEPVEQTESRLGPLTEAFALDQQTAAAKAKSELGWQPQQPTLLDDLRTGSYSR